MIFDRVVRAQTVFPNAVYQGCVLNDNQGVQRLIAELCRVSLRGPDSGIADPADVIIRATEFHQRFRVSLRVSSAHWRRKEK